MFVCIKRPIPKNVNRVTYTESINFVSKVYVFHFTKSFNFQNTNDNDVVLRSRKGKDEESSEVDQSPLCPEEVTGRGSDFKGISSDFSSEENFSQFFLSKCTVIFRSRH